MRVIRRSVFETASSSVHSVTLKGKPEAKPYLLRGGKLKIEPGQFGWGPEEYADPTGKASYAWTWLLETNNDRGPLREMLESVLKEWTGAEEVVLVEPARDKYGWSGCYIDHQSLESSSYDPTPPVGEQIFKDAATLAQFIFGNSVLEIDNDNH